MDAEWRAAATLDMEIPVEVLRREHRMTRRMLRVLLDLANRIESGAPFPAADVAVVLGYFREFVEQVHHRKETVVFYPFAAMTGGEAAAEQVGVLIADHDESKLLLHTLTVFWEPCGLRGAEGRAFAEVARTYGGRLQRHMAFEEECLFPIASEVPGDERIRFIEDFDRIGADYRTSEYWEAELTRLERRYPG